MKFQEIKKRDEEDDGEDGVPLHTLANSPNHHSMKRNWKKEEEEKERERDRLEDKRMNSFEFISI